MPYKSIRKSFCCCG